MSLLTLPDKGYTYLSIESGGLSLTWTSTSLETSGPQYWVDHYLDPKEYQPAIWWKFWKKTITFKVFACGGSEDCSNPTPFYQTIKLQLK